MRDDEPIIIEFGLGGEDVGIRSLRFILDQGLQDKPKPKRYWYMSFADDDGFRGACIVQADEFLDAVSKSRRLGCNPGGQILGGSFDGRNMDFPPACFDPANHNRLLSEAELLSGLLGDVVHPNGKLAEMKT